MPHVNARRGNTALAHSHAAKLPALWLALKYRGPLDLIAPGYGVCSASVFHSSLGAAILTDTNEAPATCRNWQETSTTHDAILAQQPFWRPVRALGWLTALIFSTLANATISNDDGITG
jgi:hypothetical protein